MKIIKGWHVLYVRSKQEVKVYQLLQEQGIDAFLPMTTVIRQWSDRKKKLKVPLFTSYVFVNINSTMDFHKVLNLKGACEFLKFGNEYARIRQSEIDRICLLLNTNGIRDVKSVYNQPSFGETMHISEGPLQGLQCKVERVDDNYKVQVSIDSMGYSIHATMPLPFLEKEISA